MSGIAGLLSTPSLPSNIQCTASAFLPSAACSSSTGSSSSTQGLRSRAGSSSPPLSSSPPSSKSLLYGYVPARKNSQVGTQATKEFVGVVVRNRAKPRGRRGCGDGGDEDDYFEEDGMFAGGGGFDDFNWGGSQGGGSGGGGFNWGGGSSGNGGNPGDFSSNNGGYSEHNALFCAAMYNSLWVWQLACLGSVAQAARFMMVCVAAARSAEMQPCDTPQSGSA